MRANDAAALLALFVCSIAEVFTNGVTSPVRLCYVSYLPTVLARPAAEARYRPAIGVVRVPMPSIVIETTSPGLRNSGGFRPAPTPSGVPVEMTSPG